MYGARSLSDSRLINDRSDPLVIKHSDSGDGSEQAGNYHYVYVDNLGIMSTNQAHVTKSLTEVQELFNGRSLSLHPGEVLSDRADVLGCRLDLKERCTGIKPDRSLRIRKAVEGILSRGRSAGRFLEVLVGHFTYAFLVNRPLMSTFHHCYRFIRRHYDQKAKLWPTVVEELEAAKTVGRLSERERFKRRAGHSARESALELLHAEAPGPLDVPEQELAEAGWETSRSFSEVPAWLLDKDRWDVKRSGKWQFAEGIYELESRALVMSLSRIACSKRGRDIRQLLLVDNMAVALSFERHRSKNFSVLKAIRRFGSLCLARNISTCIRWVPSEANAADKPSRHPGGLTETPAQSEASAPPDPLQGGAASARQGQAAAHAKGVGRPHGNLVELYLENHTLRHNDAPCRRGPTPAAEAVQSRQREHVFFDHRVRRDQGKKAERTSATQAKATTPPQVPRPGYGRPPSGYHFPQGTSSHLQGPEVLPQGGGSVQGVRQAEISSDQTQRADRRGPCSVPEPPFLVGKPATPGETSFSQDCSMPTQSLESMGAARCPGHGGRSEGGVGCARAGAGNRFLWRSGPPWRRSFGDAATSGWRCLCWWPCQATRGLRSSCDAQFTRWFPRFGTPSTSGACCFRPSRKGTRPRLASTTRRSPWTLRTSSHGALSCSRP